MCGAWRYTLDYGLFKFGLRTALASWLALVAATLLGLSSAHWAAMTVWFVAQPDRGALFEKSLFRVLGTIVGAQAGALIALVAQGAPLASILCLALWVALCAWVGNLLRHYSAYSVLLAGATAAIVVLQSVHQPSHALDLDFARVANIFIGIAVAIVFTLFFSPKTSGIDIEERLQRLRGKTLRALGAILSDVSAAKMRKLRFEVVLDIASLEDLLDHAASGSPRAHLLNRHVRAVLGAQLSLLSIASALRKTWERESHQSEYSEIKAASWCKALADVLNESVRESSLESVRKELRLIGIDMTLRGRLLIEMHDLLRTFDQEQSVIHAAHTSRSPSFNLVLHRDWLAAHYAAWRALCAIFVVGSLWVLSGWSYGNLMLMGVCMFVILFSPLENPSSVLRGIVIGSAVGGGLAIVMRTLVFPVVPSIEWILCASSPVFILGALLMSFPRTRSFGVEIVLCFLLVAQPGALSLGSGEDIAFGALALVIGSGASYLTFKLLPPFSLRRRIGELGAMVVRDLQSMVANRARNGERWLQRSSHRVLRVARLASCGQNNASAMVDGCFSVIALGRAVILVYQLLGRIRNHSSCVTLVESALESLSSLPGSPDVAAAALGESSRCLEKEHVASLMHHETSEILYQNVRQDLSTILDEMVAVITSQSEFFRFVSMTPGGQLVFAMR